MAAISDRRNLALRLHQNFNCIFITAFFILCPSSLPYAAQTKIDNQPRSCNNPLNLTVSVPEPERPFVPHCSLRRSRDQGAQCDAAHQFWCRLETEVARTFNILPVVKPATSAATLGSISFFLVFLFAQFLSHCLLIALLAGLLIRFVSSTCY